MWFERYYFFVSIASFAIQIVLWASRLQKFFRSFFYAGFDGFSVADFPYGNNGFCRLRQVEVVAGTGCLFVIQCLDFYLGTGLGLYGGCSLRE